jgi:hypothetical protein
MPEPETARRLPAPGSEPPTAPEGSASALAHHTDPSLAKPTATTPAPGKTKRPVEWVRLADVLTGRGMRLGSQSAQRHEQVIRSIRRAPVRLVGATRRAISHRSAPNLPPISSFGAVPPPGAGGQGRSVNP